jgi:SH3 domain-containing YSC84-like protein 1
MRNRSIVQVIALSIAAMGICACSRSGPSTAGSAHISSSSSASASSSVAVAAASASSSVATDSSSAPSEPPATPAVATSRQEQATAAAANSQVRDAILLVKRMKRDPKLARLLARSKGVFLMPHYGRGGIIIGGVGGPGMLFVHRNGDWYGPAFYTVGGFNIGLQLGAAKGPVAMLLMNDKTVAMFENHKHKWSMNAAAGLTVVKYGGETENTSSYKDVVLWSELKGLYGGVAIGANNITVNAAANRSYYHRNMTTRQIMNGSDNLSHAQLLHTVLAETVAKAQ